MENISAQGLRVTLRASKTFPIGINLSQFADDADAFDTPSIQIADKGLGLNGDLVVWGTNVAPTVTINVIPGSEDDRNLEILFEANRTGKGKIPARDVITLIVQYPSGDVKTFSKGIGTDYVPAPGAAAAGRLKTRPYAFAFESIANS